MLFPWIPVRLHGWLDELATLAYVGFALFAGYEASVRWLLVMAALVHFGNTRLTDYPQGQLKAYSLATHAKIELAEGLVLLVGAAASSSALVARLTLAVLGLGQVAAALAGDTRAPRGA
jgi:hypothetical protein